MYKIFGILTAIALSFNVLGQNSASLREETVKLMTYPYSDPNPVAQPASAIYPYFTYDKYTAKGKEEEWNAVVLENEYIKVTLLPSVGGKIWGATEKSTGLPFLYYNHAAKFRLVAMRGPWTSGGLEMNFGVIGHSPTTSSPVDYFTRNNPDGSVSCFIASTELITRTWWQVEVNLQPDKAYFTTRSTWYNPTPLTRPYYHWMTAAYPATDDLELFFPGQYYIGHGGDPHKFPINEAGRDISKYANNNFGPYKSYHVLGNYNDFFAAYYPDNQFGSVHHSPYDEKPGMKIWIWGLSRQGMIWEDLLTDTDGQYVELQSGRLYNQAAAESNVTPFKQFSFEPYATDHWTEYWYPFKETGGVAKANEYGALNVVRDGDKCTISFCPVQKIDDEIIVKADGKVIFSKHLNINVLQTWKEVVSPIPATAEIQVVLGDYKLVYSDAPTDNRLSRPVTPPADFDHNSAYGLYLQGQQAFYMNNLAEADSLLQKSLALEPYAIPALRNLATIYYRRGWYDKALNLAQTILSVNTYDPEGNIIYGLINSNLGNNTDAMDGFSIAALTASYRTAANILIAKEYAKKQQWRQTLAYAEKALSQDSGNLDALLLKMLIFRKTGRKDDAEKIYGLIEKEYPLFHTARFEKSLLSGDTVGFISLIRNELPYQTLIETADWYESAGCTDEAIKVLTLSLHCSEQSNPVTGKTFRYAENKSPIALIRAAYLLHFQGKEAEAKQLLSTAETLPTHLVLPSRTETLPALEWAVNQSPAWQLKYYLAILNASLNNTDKAQKLLIQCGNQPDDYAFYLTRASFLNGEDKLADLLQAEKLGQTWRAGLALSNYYEQAAQYEKMLETAKKYSSKYPDYDVIGMKYASSLLYTGQYRKCADLLAGMTVLPGEGSAEGHDLWRKAWLYQALESFRKGQYKQALMQTGKAREWRENLGAGKPYDEDIDCRAEDFLSALCCDKLNNPSKAAEYRANENKINERLGNKKEEVYQLIINNLTK